jgi:hypothetical protein
MGSDAEFRLKCDPPKPRANADVVDKDACAGVDDRHNLDME